MFEKIFARHKGRICPIMKSKKKDCGLPITGENDILVRIIYKYDY